MSYAPFCQTAEIRQLYDASRKREAESLDALNNAVNANVVVKREKKDKGTTLGDSAAAKALRAQMVAVVRENAAGGKKAAADAAVAAGFSEKEVLAYLRFAEVVDKMVFGDDEVKEGSSSSSSDNSSD